MIALAVLLSIAAHEAGHAITAAALGYSTRPVFHPRKGLGLQFGEDSMPARDIAVTAIAGPIASFAYAAPLLYVGGAAMMPGLASLAVGFINLLAPVESGDGYRTLHALRPRRRGT